MSLAIRVTRFVQTLQILAVKDGNIDSEVSLALRAIVYEHVFKKIMRRLRYWLKKIKDGESASPGFIEIGCSEFDPAEGS